MSRYLVKAARSKAFLPVNFTKWVWNSFMPRESMNSNPQAKKGSLFPRARSKRCKGMVEYLVVRPTTFPIEEFKKRIHSPVRKIKHLKNFICSAFFSHLQALQHPKPRARESLAPEPVSEAEEQFLFRRDKPMTRDLQARSSIRSSPR